MPTHPGQPFWRRHWRGLSWVFAFLLLWIIALQNLEETRIDVLFWSFLAVPKLVLLIGAMGLGAALWEVGRRILKGL